MDLVWGRSVTRLNWGVGILVNLDVLMEISLLGRNVVGEKVFVACLTTFGGVVRAVGVGWKKTRKDTDFLTNDGVGLDGPSLTFFLWRWWGVFEARLDRVGKGK